MTMVRSHALPGPLLVLTLALLVAVAAVQGHGDGGPVYGIAMVRAHLAHDPDHWVGRTISVRGAVVPCLAMPSAENGACAALAPSPGTLGRGDSAAPGASDPVPVTAAALTPFLAGLRHLPLLAALLPAPHVPPWGTLGTYRIQFRAAPAGACQSPPCYQALLLGAAPASLGMW